MTRARANPRVIHNRSINHETPPNSTDRTAGRGRSRLGRGLAHVRIRCPAQRLGALRGHAQPRQRRRHGPEVEDSGRERGEVAGGADRAHRGYGRACRGGAARPQGPCLHRRHRRCLLRDRRSQRRDRLGEEVPDGRGEQGSRHVALPERAERHAHGRPLQEHDLRDLDRRPPVRPGPRHREGEVPVSAVGAGVCQGVEPQPHR